jgi:peroxiredoxin
MRKWIGALAIGAALLAASAIAAAVEVGQPAPHFNLPATTGTNVSLKDYRGKSWVLIEFYGADFVPT